MMENLFEIVLNKRYYLSELEESAKNATLKDAQKVLEELELLAEDMSTIIEEHDWKETV